MAKSSPRCPFQTGVWYQLDEGEEPVTLFDIYYPNNSVGVLDNQMVIQFWNGYVTDSGWIFFALEGKGLFYIRFEESSKVVPVPSVFT